MLQPDHWMMGLSRVYVGDVLGRLKRFEEAEPELVEGYGVVAKAIGETHPPGRRQGWRRKHPRSVGQTGEGGGVENPGRSHLGAEIRRSPAPPPSPPGGPAYSFATFQESLKTTWRPPRPRLPVPTHPLPQRPTARMGRSKAPRNDPGLETIAAKVERGERLTLDDGDILFSTPDIYTVLELANLVRRRLHGNAAYYNINRHLNYSNVCAPSPASSAISTPRRTMPRPTRATWNCPRGGAQGR